MTTRRERDGVPTQISDVARIPGGASRETYRLKATQRGVVRGMILRRDPESSLIDTDRATEFAAYAAAFRSGVIPVPEPLVLEQDERHLGRPFSRSAEIPGCETNVQSAFAELERAYAARIGQLVLLRVNPEFDSLRGDPRFDEFVRRVGIPES
jgi:aminoglycoside phosphotransferase (APT) family kinase protein